MYQVRKICPSGSWEGVKSMKVYRQTDRQTDDMWSEKPSSTFGLSKLKVFKSSLYLKSPLQRTITCNILIVFKSHLRKEQTRFFFPQQLISNIIMLWTILTEKGLNKLKLSFFSHRHYYNNSQFSFFYCTIIRVRKKNAIFFF